MRLKKILRTLFLGGSFLLPTIVEAQSYDSLKAVEFARNLESSGFNLEGYIIKKPTEIQVDHNDSSVVIDCPLTANKRENENLMDYRFFVAFNKNNSETRFNRAFINNAGGIGFILDNNSISPQIYADSLKKMLKKTPTSVKISNAGLERLFLHEPFPNPSNGDINVKYEIEEPARINFRVYDLSCKKITAFTKDAASGEHLYRFDTGSLPSGTYFIQAAIISGKQNKTEIKKIRVIK